MSLFTRLTTWTANQLVKAADLNGEFNNLVNGLNNLDGASTAWTNVKAGTVNFTTALQSNGSTFFVSPTSYAPTYQGLGTPTNVSAYYTQVGNILFLWGQFTMGSTTASEARIGLPGGYTTNANIATAATNQMVGNCNYVAGSTTQYYLAAKPSVAYVNIVAVDATHNFGTLINGSTFFSSGNNFTYSGSVPI